jgi:hypothetical protein
MPVVTINIPCNIDLALRQRIDESPNHIGSNRGIPHK